MWKTILLIVSIPYYITVALFVVPFAFAIVYLIVHFLIGLVQGLFKDV